MGRCCFHYRDWRSIDGVVQFALTLNKLTRTAFLIVICAVVWSIWKHRNDLCFNNYRIYTAHNVILQIVSLVSYWTGTAAEVLQVAVQEWMPLDVDVIPLQVLPPDDVQMVDWVIADEAEA